MDSRTFAYLRYAVGKPGTANSRPLYVWQATDRQAANACAALLPYLRVKRAQADVLLALRESKTPRYLKVAYWFAQEFPQWPDMELVTTSEAMHLLGYRTPSMMSQAIRLGTVLALPYNHQGRVVPRIPRLLIDRLRLCLSTDGRIRRRPQELIAWRERLFQRVRELNKTGVNGTPTSHRIGPYTPLP